jgi:hypothetical protein
MDLKPYRHNELSASHQTDGVLTVLSGGFKPPDRASAASEERASADIVQVRRTGTSAENMGELLALPTAPLPYS